MTDTQTQDPARLALARLCDKPYAQPGDVTTALSQLSEHFPVVAPGGTTRCAALADGYRALVTYIVAELPIVGNDGKEVPGTGDVFKDKRTGTWCFKHSFLKKLAAGAGIEWVDEERMDNFAHPFVCAMKVKGRYRDYSGEWRQVIGSHMLDLRDDAEHGMKTEGMLKNARATIQQRCASMAKSRAIADACVSRTIADRDIGRPIVMAKLYRHAPINPAEASRALYGDQVDDDAPQVVAAEVIDTATGEVSHGNRVRDTSSDTPAPVADPRGNASASSGREPASRETSSRPKQDPNAIPEGMPGAGQTFATASLEHVRAYIASAEAQIASGKRADGTPMSERETEHRVAKMQRAMDALSQRMATEDLPW